MGKVLVESGLLYKQAQATRQLAELTGGRYRPAYKSLVDLSFLSGVLPCPSR
jgi:hypothetical protein